MESIRTGTAGNAAAKRRLPRGSLSREVILAAAAAVAQRDGFDGLTFQALGAELGAHPTAIYRHFRDKDELTLELVDALNAEALAELGEPTDDWVADLAQLAYRIHEVFLRHAAVGQMTAARTARREHEFEIVERFVSCMRRAGFNDADAARYYRVFADFVLAYSALDAALAALDPDARQADLRAWEIEYRTLPAQKYPNTAAIAHLLPALDDPGNFAAAVDLMIDSLKARAAGGLRAGTLATPGQ
jgi:AcrR family transcriptional regulator